MLIHIPYRLLCKVLAGAMTLAIMSILAVGGFEAIKGMDLVGKMVFCQGYHLSKLGQGSLASSIIGKQDYFARNLCEQTKYDNTNETMVQQENQKLSLEETEALPPASPESKQVGAIYQEQPRKQDVPENAMVNQLRRTMDFYDGLFLLDSEFPYRRCHDFSICD